MAWQDTIYINRRRDGDEIVDRAIENSKAWCKRRGITKRDEDWLTSHGYCPWAVPRGVTGDTTIYLSRYVGDPLYLRNRVCWVDGHEGSDLDPGVICLHCDLYDGDTCTCGSPNCYLCEGE